LNVGIGKKTFSFERLIFQAKRVDQSLILGKESLNGNIMVLFHGGIQKNWAIKEGGFEITKALQRFQ
jgi:hypothetical protein